MLARLTLASLAVLLLAGCGAAQSSERPAVARYIRQAGRLERQLATPLAAVSRAGASFALAQGPKATLVDRLAGGGADQALQRASGQIESVRRRLAALPAPASATRLRTMLLKLVDLQVAATRELAMLVVFVPRFASTIRPLGPATRRLELALSQRSAYGAAAVAAAYAAKAAALRRFQASADLVLRRLRRLRPPAVSRPGYRAQLAALSGMSSTAGRLAQALGNGPQSDVAQLLSEFDRAALSTQSNGAQKAQIAAVRAYDSQSDKMAALSNQITRERLRLANTPG